MTRRETPVIVWFRDDLRLGDNPALMAAVETGAPVLPLYARDAASPGLRPLGGASRWWLHRSLAALGDEIGGRGATLRILEGAAAEVLPRLAAAVGASSVVWNRRYPAAERAVDDAVAAALAAQGIATRTFAGLLGREPGDIRAKDGGRYRIYGPYWRAALASGPLPEPLPAPSILKGAVVRDAAAFRPLDALGLRPAAPDWSGGLAETFRPGEAEARRALDGFLASGLADYGTARDRPAVRGSSHLSPHLRFGEISPREVAAAVRRAAPTPDAARKAEKFMQELAWRDFAYDLLSQFPDLPTRAFAPRFADFPWAEGPPAAIRAWQRGRTGYPIVDAGMRQLWHTGWMHNRVRMITASFLVKHLLVDWRIGEAWFWDTLCDADPANNAVNWQWVAGCGPDAAPFFRVFNPVLQGEKFDPEGTYVRSFVPELTRLPDRFVHRPWEAPAAVLKQAGVVLGRTYPGPIVAHAEARERALAAFRASRRDDGRDDGPERSLARGRLEP